MIDEEELLSSDLLRLAFWMADYYHFPIGSVIETMLPTEAMRGRKRNVEPQKRWSIQPTKETPAFKNAHRQAELWNLIASKESLTDFELHELRADKQVLSALLRKDLVRWEYVENEYEYQPASLSLRTNKRPRSDPSSNSSIHSEYTSLTESRAAARPKSISK